MGFLDSAKNALSAARNAATEVLGEDGMEHLRSLKDDVAQAGGQIRQFAEEVLEDCDNDALEDAKAFYSGTYQKGRDSVRKARERAQAEREAREKERLALRARRAAMLKRAATVLICVIAAAILIVSAALLVNQRLGKEAAPSVSAAETVTPPASASEAPSPYVSVPTASS